MTDREATGGSFTLLVFVALLLTLAAVLLSAYLRLESIGVGCAPWPACFGQLPASLDHGLVPKSAAGTVHRLTASLLGLVVVAVTWLALRGRRPPGVGVAAPLAVFALTVFLSLLGYSTPTPDMPAVTLGNLLGGMAMLALLWWIGQRSVAAPAAVEAARGLQPWARLGLLIVALQIVLGALTSATFAGPACSALPGCGGGGASPGGFAQGLDIFARLAVDEQGRVVTGLLQRSVHMAHRLGAVVTLLYLAWLAIRALRPGAALRVTGLAMLVLLCVQVALGVAAVLAGLPLLLVTAHNAVAAMLLLAVVNLNHLLTPARQPAQR